MPLLSVNEASFENEVLRAQVPVLVDLYADWCQPCKQLEPILEELSRELDGKVKIVRVDVEANPLLARSFRVQSIPMMVVFAGGRPVDQLVGLVDKATIMNALKPLLPRAASEVDPAQLAQLVAEQRAVAVDLREQEAYARHHIPGAMNVPAAHLGERLDELRPNDGRLRVLYGRGGDEAREAASRLREQGIEVGFLAGGFLHWEADGHEVERGA